MSQCRRFSWHTTRYIGYPLQDPLLFQGSLFQFVTQDIVQDLMFCIQHIPYPGFSRYEFHFRPLCFRLHSQCVVCFHRFWLEVHDLFSWFSWTFLVVPLYFFFYMYHLPMQHMMSGHVWDLSVFVFIIGLEWHLPSTFTFLIRMKKKLSFTLDNL